MPKLQMYNIHDTFDYSYGSVRASPGVKPSLDISHEYHLICCEARIIMAKITNRPMLPASNA
jgi:hypothetical protein